MEKIAVGHERYPFVADLILVQIPSLVNLGQTAALDSPKLDYYYEFARKGPATVTVAIEAAISTGPASLGRWGLVQW